MRLATTHLNERVELLDATFDEDRAAQLRHLARLYNRALGPVVAVNYLRPEILDLALFSAYCHHAPLDGLIRDLLVKAGPRHGWLSGGGKGASGLDALLGALGEMAERLLGTLHGATLADRLVYGSYDELARAGRRALSPEELPLFAPEQYAAPGFEYVPFRPDTFLGWAEGRDLLSDEPVLVPAQVALMYYKRRPAEPAIGYATTAGGAFHTSRREAILHGLYEVIERDGLNLTWYCRLPPPRVALDLRDVMERFLDARALRLATPYIPEVQVFCATLDTPIPVLIAIAVDRSRHERAFLGGSGASSRRERGLAQALFEVGQCQTAFRFDNPFGRNPIYADSDLSEVVEFFDAPLYFGHACNLPRTAWYTASDRQMRWDDVPTRRYADEAEEYDATLAWLRRTSLRPIVLDFDDACWPGAAITKVFVPQLSHACPPRNPPLGHPRFSELPRQLGLADRALTFADLSTDPIPFA